MRYATSISDIVERRRGGGETTVLCDPWLLDGAFSGAWHHYPPLEFAPEEYGHVDYLYISPPPGRLHPPT